MATFDQSGVNIDTFDVVYDNLAQRLAQKINPLLPVGETVDTSSTSIFGRLISLIAEPIAQQEQLIQQIALSKDIDSATGLDLDDIVRLSNMYRKAASPAYAYLILYGDIGTLVNTGNLVSSKQSGDIFSTLDTVTFGVVNCIGVEYNVGSFVAGDVFSIDYIVDGSLNQYVPIAVTATTTDTATTICAKLALQTSVISSVIKATADADRITFQFIDENLTGEFVATANLVAERSYMGVGSESTTLADVQLEQGSINTITTSVLGWRGVYNPFPSVAATPDESDESLRFRYKNILGSQFGNKASMEAALNAISGVRYVKIQENVITSVTPDGRSGNGIAVVVLGGSEQLIAQTIFNYNSVGCLTDGDITEVITDINGGSQEVKFSRPNTKEIEIVMSLIVYPDFPTNGVDLIRQKIVEYFDTLGVGESVALSRLYTPMNEIKGFAINTIKAGVVGSAVYYNNIVPIAYNEIATISYSDIKFGGA